MTTSTPVESTMAYLVMLAERDQSTPEIICEWIAVNLALSKFSEGNSHFLMMLDSSIVIFTDLPDDTVNAAVFASPSAMLDSLQSHGPEFAQVDPKMVAELSRINALVGQVCDLLDPHSEVGHA